MAQKFYSHANLLHPFWHSNVWWHGIILLGEMVTKNPAWQDPHAGKDNYYMTKRYLARNMIIFGCRAQELPLRVLISLLHLQRPSFNFLTHSTHSHTPPTLPHLPTSSNTLGRTSLIAIHPTLSAIISWKRRQEEEDRNNMSYETLSFILHPIYLLQTPTWAHPRQQEPMAKGWP